MPWVVFEDFNEILHPGEKIGGLDRDAKQMEDLRECLSRCELHDLGYFGQHYTWCNGRFGDQRTNLKLDRMVANKAWMRIFPQARVQHVSLSISDHCLLALSIKRRQPQKPAKKGFFFEEMWTREEGCREIVESAWDPLWVDPEYKVTDRIRSCQNQLQKWNWKVFGNVHQVLRQKKERLQHLEARDSLHKEAEEIQRVKKEINESLIREEIM